MRDAGDDDTDGAPEDVTEKDIPQLMKDLRALLDECDNVRKRFVSEYPTFEAKRDSVVKEIKEIAEKLHGTHKDVAIANVVGASTGIVAGSTATVSGAVGIIALCLAPFTLGASLPVAAAAGVVAGVSGGVAVAGGVTGGIASLVECGITKGSCKTAQKSLDDFAKARNDISDLVTQLMDDIDVIDVVIEDLNELQKQLHDKNETRKELATFSSLLRRSASMNGMRKVLYTSRTEAGDVENPTGSVTSEVIKQGANTGGRGVPVAGQAGGKVGGALGGRVGEAVGEAAGQAVGRQAGSLAERVGGRWIGRAVSTGVGRLAARAGAQAGRTAGVTVGRVAGQVAGRALGSVVSAVFVGVDIYFLVSASMDLHKGGKSEAGEELDKLLAEMDIANKVLEQLNKECAKF